MTGLAFSILAAWVTLAAEPSEDSPSPIESVIGAFASSDWPTVDGARSELESRPNEAVPALIALLDRDEYIPLQNTMGLIYPGAKTFYGHGASVDYDIDWLPVRAGWVLEAITFESFGFKEECVDEGKLLEAARVRFGDWPLDLVVNLKGDPKLKAKLRSDASKRAKEWWQKSSNGWSRFHGLLDALRSDDPIRQASAVVWLRSGRTRCDGLNRRTYAQRVWPEIVRLAESNDEHVSKQAKLLLLDGSDTRSYCGRCGYDLTREFYRADEQRRRAIAKCNAAIREGKAALVPEHLWELSVSEPWHDIHLLRCPKCGEEAGLSP